MAPINKKQKDYLTDLAVVTGGAVTGMLVDSGVNQLWVGAGLPAVGIGTFHLDDMLLLLAEGVGGYYLYKKGKKKSTNFVIGMFAATAMYEIGEAIMSAINPLNRIVQGAQAKMANVNQITRYVIA